MKMALNKCMKESDDEQTTRKRKRERVDLFVFLPDDMLLEILKRVPEAFLRYKAKYVCKKWFSVITDRVLLSHASYILHNLVTHKTRVVDIMEKEEGIQVKEQDVDIPPHKGTIRSWCNEFVLISDVDKNLYVYNLITKEGSYLPECNTSCGNYIGKCGVGLSFDRCKGIYKVAHMFIGRTVECHILTLRRNLNRTITRAFSNWKKIQVPCMYRGQHIRGDPLTVQGRYLSWIIFNPHDLVCVDMVKEEIQIISLPGPRSSNDEEFVYSIFVMGGFLGLMNRVSRDKPEIWLLKDFEKVKWEKVQSISDTNRYFGRSPGKGLTYPICGVIRKRYMILKSLSGMFSYDLRSGVLKKLDIHIQYKQIHSLERPLECSLERCKVHSLAPSFK